MKVSLLIAAFFASTGLLAQKKEGVLVFERKQNLHRTMNEEMRAMIPEFRSTKQMLIFSEQQSLYKALPQEEAPDPFTNNKGGLFMNVGSRSSETYFHFGQNKKLTLSDLFGDTYLITDTIKKYDWKLVDETKTIAGFTCKKATTTTKTFRQSIRVVSTLDPANAQAPKPEETEVIAWYAVDMPSPAGPEGYVGLPGVVMELDIDKGGTVFTVEEVRPLSDPAQLKEPKKGRKVTQEEYAKEMKKAIDNMRSGPIQIRTGQ